MIRTRNCLSLATFVVAALAPRVSAQPPAPAAPPEVATAQAAFRAGLADSAVRTLESFFARNSTAVQGRLLLGNAYARLGDTARALAAYEGITAPRPMRLQATFQIAGIQAKRGNADVALAKLAELKASGAFDLELARTSADFGSLRSDPRFDGVMFRPADFERPFVEPVRVIHEWRGETKGDQFSWVARGIGDVDGDKASDIVTSAPTFGASGTSPGQGRVYVYSGRTGRLLWQQTGEAGDVLGNTIEGAGDVNRDGVADVIAAAPGAGKAFVYSGRDGAVLLRLVGTTQERYAGSVAGVGDQNGDGHADVAVGAPACGAAAQGAGCVYVVSGKDGTVLTKLDGEAAGDAFGSTVAGAKWGKGTQIVVGASGGGAQRRGKVYSFRALAAKPAFVIETDSTGGALGAMFVSVVGDVNGDKVPDVYASDFANSAKGPMTGRVYVRSGADGARLHTLTGEHTGDGFGIGSADVGDVDRDGYDDLLIGAWQYSTVAASGGKVYLYSGKSGALLRSITGRVPGETFGFDATGVGDVDGDGVIDLLVTSSWSNVNGYRSGRMFVISGK